MAKTTIYGIYADNLFDDKDGGLWHNTEIHTNGTSYEEAYKRITELVPKVFPTGKGVRYSVYVGVWDDSLPNGGQYSKPGTGIPKSDLDSSVQQSLDNGDTALSTLQSIGKPLVWHGPADVATLNGTISGLGEGWIYTLTDSGILTSGSVNVDVGDEVAWTGSAWFKVGGEGGTKVFKVSYSTSINDYVYPTYAEVNAAVQANKVPVILRYIHDSPVRQCFVFKSLSLGYINFENNEMYVTISSSDTVEYGYINDRNLAAGYDPSATYALGAYCMYQNVLYTCITAIPNGEPWTSSHWAGTSVSEQIGNVEALLAAL